MTGSPGYARAQIQRLSRLTAPGGKCIRLYKGEMGLRSTWQGSPLHARAIEKPPSPPLLNVLSMLNCHTAALRTSERPGMPMSWRMPLAFRVSQSHCLTMRPGEQACCSTRRASGTRARAGRAQLGGAGWGWNNSTDTRGSARVSARLARNKF